MNLKYNKNGYMENDGFVFFYGKDSPFSNFYIINFCIDGINFNCSEQAFMYYKAKLFEDHNSMDLILNEKSPVNQKILGRQVKNFNHNVWNGNCSKIVTTILEYKFTSNNDMTKVLLDTQYKMIVEANKFDCKWGIGLDINNPDILHLDRWKGKNLLGICLMFARKNIKEQMDFGVHY